MSDPLNEAAGSTEGPREPVESSAGSVHSDQVLAQVARRLNGAGAAVLILEALVVLFVPRAIAQSGPGLTPWRLAAVLGVVMLLVVVAALQRRAWGPQAGLVVQVAVLATGFLTAVMWFLGALFTVLWVYLLRIRADLLGSPASPPSKTG